MNIGFCGAHRTGKTTLANSLASRAGLSFLRTSTSSVFKARGIDPAAPMSFETRIDIQFDILRSYEDLWCGGGGGIKQGFVSDRTPLDLMAYTLADVQGHAEFPEQLIADYMQRCFALTNKVFTAVVLVQPGLSLVKADGKGPLNMAYIEHLNSLILGFCHDERNQADVLVINRSVTDLSTRIRAVQLRTAWLETKPQLAS